MRAWDCQSLPSPLIGAFLPHYTLKVPLGLYPNQSPSFIAEWINVVAETVDNAVRGIRAKDKSIRELLSNVQYSIDFYQREYQWQSKQCHELIADLTGRFLDAYRPSHVRQDVAQYPAYYLGSIVLSKKTDGLFIVDGQQRLTTLTLLLIYLRNQQRQFGETEDPNLDSLIQSTQYGKKNFNIDVDDRRAVIDSLYNGTAPEVNPVDSAIGVSAANMAERYVDIEESFPDQCKGQALAFFADWLIERVQMVEIIAFSDEDAYTVFETMNDRGLTLSPADMLKGYLLSNIRDVEVRSVGDEIWKTSVSTLQSSSAKDAKNDFFRTWFRGQFAQSVGHPKDTDYERLGPEFHRWLRAKADNVGLKHSDDFARFVTKELPVFARVYTFLNEAQSEFTKHNQLLYYVSQARIDDGLLYMSVVSSTDSREENEAKIRIVARFLDIFVYRRLWAGKNLTKPALKASFLPLARELRDLDLPELTARLYAELTKPGHDDFGTPPPLLTNSYRRKIHRLLARLINHVEQACTGQDPYPNLVVVSGRSRYDIEHIWPHKFHEYRNLFNDESEFESYRNRLGSLLLIPSYLNQSYNAMKTSQKIPMYGRSDHPLLVASLASSAYQRNPAFTEWIKKSGLNFVPYDLPDRPFNKTASDSRLELYRELARQIWSAENIISDSGLQTQAVRERASEIRSSLVTDVIDDDSGRVSGSVKLLDLILAGVIRAGDRLIGREAGATSNASATVLDDGRIELENGNRHTAPSSAAMDLGLDKTINGWTFWIHQPTKCTLADLRQQLLSIDEGQIDLFDEG
jgi:hypothetical protein